MFSRVDTRWLKSLRKQHAVPSGGGDSTEYHVKVPEYAGNEYDLTFSSRSLAREYKRVLKSSKRQLQAMIVKREYDQGYILSEKEVW